MLSEQLPTVYLETSVISYLAARPSRDLIIAARQEVSRRLWDHYQDAYRFTTSYLVAKEASAGSSKEAAKRLAIIETIEQIQVTGEATPLAEAILHHTALPAKASDDAWHVAISDVNGIRLLASWNLKHLVNARIRARIEEVCYKCGYTAPSICTPEQSIEEDEDAIRRSGII